MRISAPTSPSEGSDTNPMNTPSTITFTLGHGKKKYQISLSPDSPLSELIEIGSRLTGIPADHIKLLHAGTHMKDPEQRLRSYEIKDGHLVMMMATPVAALKDMVEVSNVSPEERKLLDTLRKHVEHATTVELPLLAEYKAAQHDPGNKLYLRATEVFLQTMLKIDGVQPQEGMVTLRAKRKEAVKLIQSWLDECDRIKESRGT